MNRFPVMMTPIGWRNFLQFSDLSLYFAFYVQFFHHFLCCVILLVYLNYHKYHIYSNRGTQNAGDESDNDSVNKCGTLNILRHVFTLEFSHKILTVCDKM